MSQPIFAFDEDEQWQSVGNPPTSSSAPTPTPEHSPRTIDERRARSSSASRYFGRVQRVNGESGSVTWVRVEV